MIKRPLVRYYLLIQLFVIVFGSFIVFCFNKAMLSSAVLGGLSAFVPQALFARKCFSYSGAQSMKLIVKCFYVGEFIKIISSIAFLSIVFMFCTIEPMAFFSMYIAIIMMHWLASLTVNNNMGSKSDRHGI